MHLINGKANSAKLLIFGRGRSKRGSRGLKGEKPDTSVEAILAFEA
jgi:hypothetical protein